MELELETTTFDGDDFYVPKGEPIQEILFDDDDEEDDE